MTVNKRKRASQFNDGASHELYDEYVDAYPPTPSNISHKRVKTEDGATGGSMSVKNEPHVPGAWPGKPGFEDPYAGFDLPPQLNPFYDPVAQAVPGNGGAAAPVGHWLSRSGFHLNYDEAGPLRSIDRGGPDHHEQLSDVSFIPSFPGFIGVD
jgi:hypothetical protein